MKKIADEDAKQTQGDDCIICFYPMDIKPTTKTNCGHKFHTECLEKWKSKKNTCPICRKPLEDRRSSPLVYSAAVRAMRL